ncbi:MAG: energy transducer TonB [Sulfuritalea sp.]|jgi:protein TonB|nr:energy transducer TonB [Sulfuritalea sp.]
MTFQSMDMRGLATRRLRYAVVASLLVHLLILWPANLRVLTKDTPSLLQATLRSSPQPPAELLPPKPPQRTASPAPTLAAAPAPKPQALVLEQPKPSPVPQTLAAGSEPAPAAAVVSAAPAVGLPGAARLTEASTSGEVVDGLRGYRLALAIEARRFKRYPPQAMASGWAGSAEIRVEVGRDGRPRAATVVRSSGHEALDRAALTMIDAGALRARLPESLRGKAFAVVLPVVFNLEDE